MKTCEKKGFIQHPRLYFGAFKNPVLFSHLNGVCYGASTTWLAAFHETGNDSAFWDMFSPKTASMTPLAAAQNSRTPTESIRFGVERFANNANAPVLWSGGGGPHGLKLYIITFGSVRAPSCHALAAAGRNDAMGHKIFDPNLGQFEIGLNGVNSAQALWKELWRYYGIQYVSVRDAYGADEPLTPEEVALNSIEDRIQELD